MRCSTIACAVSICFSSVSAHATINTYNEMSTCSWSKPGRAPFTGDKYDAVDMFAIPALDRDVIKRNIEKRQPTTVVRFRRDSIRDDEGNAYRTDFTPMFFGANTLCWNPSRAKWKDSDFQEGDLFCSGPYCVAVPYVCGNVTQLFPLNGEVDDGPQAPAAFVPPRFGPGYGQDGPGHFPGHTETFAQWWQRWFGGGGGWKGEQEPPTHSVPEPSTTALLLAGAAMLSLSRRKAKT